VGGLALIGLVAAYMYNGHNKDPGKAAAPHLNSSDRGGDEELDTTAFEKSNPLHNDGASGPMPNAHKHSRRNFGDD